MGIVSQQSFKITMDKKEAKKFMTLLHSDTCEASHSLLASNIIYVPL